MKNLFWIFAAIALTGQWITCHLFHSPLPVPWNAVLPGLGIFGSAFLLSWAAELAQLEMPQALALAILALIAVLPEYAVDIYFAWSAGKDPHYIAYATANMTGANRLLIGVGWPVVLLAYWIATRKREIVLEPAQGVEIAVLFIATCYSFVIPLKGTISVVDAVVFLSIFGWYIFCASRCQHVEPELGGPAEWIAKLPLTLRRLVMCGFFILSGYTIYAAAQPFAEGLLTIGRRWGIEEFVLVQWLAPLASESPEFVVAILFALRASAGTSLGTLVSSKVNQWTLLIGMLPLAYSLSAKHLGPMHLDARQIEEIFLTSAQSFLAVSVLSNFKFSVGEALLLFTLFGLQLMFPSPQVRYFFGGLYLLLTGFLLVGRRDRRQAVFKLLTQSWPPRRKRSG